MGGLFIRAYCDGCGYSQPSPRAGGLCYLLEDGYQLPVQSELQWCGTCGEFARAESLDAQHWLDVLGDVRTRLASVRQTRTLFRSRWTCDEKALFSSDFYAVEATAERMGQWALELEQAIRGLEFLRSRTAPAKCLGCGDAAAQPNGPTDDIVHPGCGGNLQFRVMGSYSGPSNQVAYSPAGDYLGTIEDGVLHPKTRAARS